jgi:hypothetical protein
MSTLVAQLYRQTRLVDSRRWLRRARQIVGEIIRKLQQPPGSLDVETEALDQGDDGYDSIEFADEDDEI